MVETLRRKVGSCILFRKRRETTGTWKHDEVQACVVQHGDIDTVLCTAATMVHSCDGREEEPKGRGPPSYTTRIGEGRILLRSSEASKTANSCVMNKRDSQGDGS